MAKKIIAIDFDGVLHNPYDVSDGRKMGNPIAGSLEAMRYLKDIHRAKLIIFTVNSREVVEEWLVYFGFPFDKVTNEKPYADIYIDDKGLHFTDWNTALEELKERVL